MNENGSKTSPGAHKSFLSDVCIKYNKMYHQILMTLLEALKSVTSW